DVRRFLSDEVVEARPPSAWYRFQKMARRHKAAVTTVSLVAATLLLGFVVSAWQAVRASRAEDAALTAQVEAVKGRDEEARQRQLAVAHRDKAREEGNKAKAARDAERARAGELATALATAEQAQKAEMQRAAELKEALKKADETRQE